MERGFSVTGVGIRLWGSCKPSDLCPHLCPSIITKRPSQQLWQVSHRQQCQPGGVCRQAVPAPAPLRQLTPLQQGRELRVSAVKHNRDPAGRTDPSSLPWASVPEREGAGPLPSPRGGHRWLGLGGQQALPEGVHHRLRQARSHWGGGSVGGCSRWSHLQPCHGHPAAGRHPRALPGKRREEACVKHCSARSLTFAGDQGMPSTLLLLPFSEATLCSQAQARDRAGRREGHRELQPSLLQEE